VFRAHVVACADDFVILSRGRAAEALAWTKVVMTRIGLTINEAKTSLKDACRERFDFLGYSFGPQVWSTAVLGVGRDGERGLGRRLREQVVDHALVLTGDVAQLGRQRVDDMEILDRQQLGLPLGDRAGGPGPKVVIERLPRLLGPLEPNGPTVFVWRTFGRSMA
jgi:hypothetical protein